MVGIRDPALGLQMAKEKRNKVLGILLSIANGDIFTAKDLDSVMGRLQWACPLAKPLLQPLWQWKGAVKPSGRPNKLVRTFAKLIWALLRATSSSPLLTANLLRGGELAMPTQVMRGAMWLAGSATKILSRRRRCGGSNSTQLPAPTFLRWKCLAPLLTEKGARNRLHFCIPLISDNQGNVFAMLNQSTQKMPTAAILMQLVLSLPQGLAPSQAPKSFWRMMS